MKLTKSKAKSLSMISADIAQVFFAASVASFALPIDSDKMLVVIWYLLVAILFWFLAIIFGEKGKL